MIFRVVTYPTAPLSCPAPTSTLTSNDNESTETLDQTTDVRPFAILDYSACQSGNWFRTQREDSRVLQDVFHSRVIPSHALLAAIETASTHILNTHISHAKALVVGLATEDIAFPFHSFW